MWWQMLEENKEVVAITTHTLTVSNVQMVKTCWVDQKFFIKILIRNTFPVTPEHVAQMVLKL